MSTVVVATSPGGVRALEVVKNRHARLADDLAVQVEALLEAAPRAGLSESSEDSLAVILTDMHQPLSGPVHSEYAEAAAECGCGGECGCGHQHPADLDTPAEDPAR